MDMKIKSDVLCFENNLLHAYNFMLYFICNRASNISFTLFATFSTVLLLLNIVMKLLLLLVCLLLLLKIKISSIIVFTTTKECLGYK